MKGSIMAVSKGGIPGVSTMAHIALVPSNGSLCTACFGVSCSARLGEGTVIFVFRAGRGWK